MGRYFSLAVVLIPTLVLGTLGCREHSMFDFDGDGVVDEDDCAPQDPDIFPGAGETCTDGVDNDCDGWIDGEDGDCQHDSDGDGYSTPEDCDDGDAAVNPSESEVTCDGKDNDCDALTEDEPDNDGDGSSVCEDCDDWDAAVHPEVSEVYCDGVDNDCDPGTEDEPDNDGDGWTVCDDCDDSEETVHAGMEEICGDGLDNDCDGGPNDCVMEGEILLANADVKLVGEDSDEYAGHAVASAGNLDTDPADEVLVGAPYGMYRGIVYVIDDPTGPVLDLSMATARLIGERDSSEAGQSLAASGDADGDGSPDFIVGAPGYMQDRGAAYLFNGPLTGELDMEFADAKMVGPEGPAEECGYVVGGGSDLTGDGIEDLLVGAPSAAGWTGRVYLVPGPVIGELELSVDAHWIDPVHQGVGMGEALAAVGDIDGDGQDDLLVSALYENVGTAYLLYGPIVGDTLLSAAAVEFGDGGDLTGISLGAAGDVNGDGAPDLMIGALPINDMWLGGLFLVEGPMTGDLDLSTQASAQAHGEDADDDAGTSLAAVGDIDGDGFDDLLVGAPMEGGDTSAGAAYLVNGPLTGTLDLADADAKLVGEAHLDHAGLSLASADVNGDGIPDILVGAPYNDAGGSQAGAAYIVYGRGGL